jgi:two-component system sensor histidine kinase UhpB
MWSVAATPNAFESGDLGGPQPRPPSGQGHPASLRLIPASLFWRVFLVNAALATAGVVLLAVSPLTVSNPATGRQVLLLAIGLAVMLAANVVLLRISLRPLGQLTQLMRRIDLLRPGQRLQVDGARELTVVLSAFNEMLDRLEQERRSSSTRSVDREEAERRRIATELHDQVGQGLTALLLQLKDVLADAPEPSRTALVEAQVIARENLDEVRRIARRLRPSVLDDLGLTYALRSLADTVGEQTGLTIVADLDPVQPEISQAAELAIYRVAQEAITNVIRHSDAGRVELVLEATETGDALRLAVHDDGRGMIYAADVEGGGVRGMRERALAVDGELVISTRPGGGTTVCITVPTRR